MPRLVFSSRHPGSMARKSDPEDEAAPRPRAISLRAGTGDDEDAASTGGAEAAVDSRLLDLEPQTDSPFLRAQKRVPVRRGPLPRKAANRLKHLVVVVVVGASVAFVAAETLRYGRQSWRFRLDSSDQVQLSGNHHVSRAQVMEIFGGDISRNIFLIPLDDRKRQLEQIPWVESATVMRLFPNRLSVELRERTPVAYAQVGMRVRLVDGNGMLMSTPPGTQYSFPVILGFTGTEPLASRAARMRVYQSLMSAMDSGEGNYSRDISEVDLADTEDVRITVADSHGEVLIHLGSEDFLERYKLYVAHAQGWRQQYHKLESVDLRYGPQVVVKPANGADSEQPATTAAGERGPAQQRHAVPKPRGKLPTAVRHRH